MKTLEDFKTESIELKSFFGGQWLSTNPPDTCDANGCTVKTTDSFYDSNGNGVYDKGESATKCVSISC